MTPNNTALYVQLARIMTVLPRLIVLEPQGGIIKVIDTEILVMALFSWANRLREATSKPLIVIDGKTLRGAVNQHDASNALHLVSAFDTEQGVVLYQQDTQTKGNEIATVQALLHMLDIKDAVVTFDALHCQQETLQQIIKAKRLCCSSKRQPTATEAGHRDAVSTSQG